MYEATLIAPPGAPIGMSTLVGDPPITEAAMSVVTRAPASRPPLWPVWPVAAAAGDGAAVAAPPVVAAGAVVADPLPHAARVTSAAVIRPPTSTCRRIPGLLLHQRSDWSMTAERRTQKTRRWEAAGSSGSLERGEEETAFRGFVRPIGRADSIRRRSEASRAGLRAS